MVQPGENCMQTGTLNWETKNLHWDNTSAAQRQWVENGPFRMARNGVLWRILNANVVAQLGMNFARPIVTHRWFG